MKTTRRAIGLVLAAVGMLMLGAASTGTPATGQPAAPEFASSDWASVSAGLYHTCGVRSSGRLYCWGADADGQLGDGGTNDDQPTPVEVAGGATNWSSVSAGAHHTCARKTNGRLYCWGADADGQLGNGGTTTSQPTPVEVSGGRTDWASVSAGSNHSCARRTTGRLFCWGDDNFGQVGNDASLADRLSPIEVSGARTDWASVSAGDSHTCARRTTSRVYCWGRDNFGQVGNDVNLVDRATPVQLSGATTDWSAVSAGGYHTCARKSSGRLYCWGRDTSGQVGDDSGFADQAVPIEVSGARTDWSAVTAGYDHTCARRTTNLLLCWGDIGFGQVGDPRWITDQGVPREVAGQATDWGTIDAGGFHTCARTSTSRLYCWGRNDTGQVGDGQAPVNSTYPVPVIG